MILKRLQASFGKLDGAVLTLQPGLNLLYAPNEGGKSTWCAFLLAMLYGIDASINTSPGPANLWPGASTLCGRAGQ